MRLIQIAVLLTVVFGAYYVLVKDEPIHNDSGEISSVDVENKDSKLESKEIPDRRSAINLEGDTFQWMNKSADQLKESFGDPSRKDPSAYGYEWWMYADNKSQYVQFGIEDNHIKSIYALGSDLSLGSAALGQTYSAVEDNLSFNRNVTFSQDSSFYTFRLSDKELRERPLVKVSDDIFLQLYFDTFTDKLTAVRMLSADILLLHRPYEIQYRGELAEKPDFSDEKWAKIERGAEQQIFHISNAIRSQYGKSGLAWDKTVSNVASLHSEDMAQNNYFSHYGQDGDGLKERLAAKNVLYRSAGENIAAQYPDAPAAIHGWLNSEGHREALLNDEFTHLGVGVYQFYYTQNFLQKQ
ncbi:putative membrane protein YlbC [Lentibacillus kapialis]|uniref:Membrane protein YlbC n=1 Tax=Lentibacillus kapialis TaxID=340214 RepID=A0A917UUT6_9BACI|nr:CAP domain-containing protein [Lentibacillus kapialis]GGJ86896.1 putative membrane protein YlbC [Lentibacillus kapialis]